MKPGCFPRVYQRCDKIKDNSTMQSFSVEYAKQQEGINLSCIASAFENYLGKRCVNP